MTIFNEFDIFLEKHKYPSLIKKEIHLFEGYSLREPYQIER